VSKLNNKNFYDWRFFAFATGVVDTGTLSCEYLREFSKKIRNNPDGILRGLGETDSWKKTEVENLVTLSL
jgi:hypothetical protein